MTSPPRKHSPFGRRTATHTEAQKANHSRFSNEKFICMIPNADLIFIVNNSCILRFISLQIYRSMKQLLYETIETERKICNKTDNKWFIQSVYIMYFFETQRRDELSKSRALVHLLCAFESPSRILPIFVSSRARAMNRARCSRTLHIRSTEYNSFSVYVMSLSLSLCLFLSSIILLIGALIERN